MDATREKMVAYRKSLQASVKQMADRCGMGAFLLENVERGWLTHPHIAVRIVREYKLDVDDYNALVAKHHRVDVLPEGCTPSPEWKGYYHYYDNVIKKEGGQ